MRGSTVVDGRRWTQGDSYDLPLSETRLWGIPDGSTPGLPAAAGVPPPHNACHGGLTRACPPGGTGVQSP
jgi:hypothetical protein